MFDCCLNPSGAETEKADALPVVKHRVLHQQGLIRLSRKELGIFLVL
nr:MAG TPA: Thrombospondin type 1 repeat [Herelleviridae sp.]